MDEQTTRLAIKTAILAGKLLMQYGSETTRAEDTMNRMIEKSIEEEDRKEYDTYIILNGIFVRIGDFHTSFIQVANRKNHLAGISQVNQISRNYAEGKITLEEACESLQQVEKNLEEPLDLLHILSAILLGASVVFLFSNDATWRDSLPAVFASLTSYLVYRLLSKKMGIAFAGEFFATFCGGLIGFLFCQLTGGDFHLMTFGAVIPLVPGIAITNSIRDVLNRHYVTGVIRFVECICIGAALGGGIALVSFVLRWGGIM